jgi:proline dehydrogenase
MSNVPVISFLAYQIAKNWIAGKSIKEAIKYSKRANARGFSAVVNYLGEEIREATEVQKTTEEYHRLLNSMRAEGIDGSISVKLTQLGLNLDKEYCRKNLEEIEFRSEDRKIRLDRYGELKVHRRHNRPLFF